MCVYTHTCNLKWNNAKAKHIDRAVEMSQMEGDKKLDLDGYMNLF